MFAAVAVVIYIVGVLVLISHGLPSTTDEIDTSIQMCDDCPNACSCSFYVHNFECILESDRDGEV